MLCGSYWLGINEFVQLHGYTVLVSLQLQTLHPNIYCLDCHHLACLLNFCIQSSSCCLQSTFSWNFNVFRSRIWRHWLYKWKILNLIQDLLQLTLIESFVPSATNKALEDSIFNQQHLNTTTTVTLNFIYNVTVSLQHLYKSLHAKSLNKEICWFCPQHGDGKAQVITLTQLLPLLQLKPSAAGKMSPVCNKIIEARYAASTYHYSIPSCDQVCYLIVCCLLSYLLGFGWTPQRSQISCTSKIIM